MHYLLFVGLFLLLVYGPQWWVQWVLNRYNRKTEENFPGTGGEFARHLPRIVINSPRLRLKLLIWATITIQSATR